MIRRPSAISSMMLQACSGSCGTESASGTCSARARSALLLPEPGPPNTIRPRSCPGRSVRSDCRCRSGSSAIPSTIAPAAGVAELRPGHAERQRWQPGAARALLPPRPIDDRLQLLRGCPGHAEGRRGAVPGSAHQREAATGRVAGQRRGRVRADHRAAVRRVGDAQRDPQRAVRGQRIPDHSRGALRSQDQVHPQRAAARRDVREDRREVGMLLQERGELVDDDDQAREHSPGVRDAAHPVRCEHLLSAPQLGAQAAHTALRAARVQVGDDGGDVRQRAQRLERGAALEVREHETHLLRRVHGGKSGHPAHQELALARPRHSRDQRVRAVGHEIHDDRSVGVATEHDGQRIPGETRRRRRLRETREIGAESLPQGHRGGDPRLAVRTLRKDPHECFGLILRDALHRTAAHARRRADLGASRFGDVDDRLVARRRGWRPAPPAPVARRRMPSAAPRRARRARRVRARGPGAGRRAPGRRWRPPPDGSRPARAAGRAAAPSPAPRRARPARARARTPPRSAGTVTGAPGTVPCRVRKASACSPVPLNRSGAGASPRPIVSSASPESALRRSGGSARQPVRPGAAWSSRTRSASSRAATTSSTRSHAAASSACGPPGRTPALTHPVQERGEDHGRAECREAQRQRGPGHGEQHHPRDDRHDRGEEAAAVRAAAPLRGTGGRSSRRDPCAHPSRIRSPAERRRRNPWTTRRRRPRWRTRPRAARRPRR